MDTEDPHAWLVEGNRLYEAREMDAAFEAWSRARALAREQGEAEVELFALSNTGAMLIGASRARDARPILEEALAGFAQHGGSTAELRRVLRNLAWACELDEDDEAAERCNTQLRASYGETEASARDRALNVGNAAVRAHLRGEAEEAERLYLEALDLSRASGARRNLGHVLENLGNLRSSLGRYHGVEALYEEALKIHTAEKNAVGIASSTGLLANVYFSRGDLDGAVERWSEAADRWDLLGNRANAAQMRINLAWASLERREPEAARAALERAVEDARALGDPGVEGDATDALGLYERTRGAYDLAVEHHRAAAGLLEEGRRFGRVYVAELHEGIAHALAGRGEAAEAVLARAQRRAEEQGDPTTPADVGVWLALLAWRDGDPEAARAHLDAATASAGAAANERLDRTVAAARAALEGRAVTLDSLPGRAIRAFMEVDA